MKETCTRDLQKRTRNVKTWAQPRQVAKETYVCGKRPMKEINGSTYCDDWMAAAQVIATRCNTLQHAATRCNTLQHTAAHIKVSYMSAAMPGGTRRSPFIIIPPHTTTHCNALQHTATQSNTLQHTSKYHTWAQPRQEAQDGAHSYSTRASATVGTPPPGVHGPLIKILKSQLATKMTLCHHRRADYWKKICQRQCGHASTGRTWTSDKNSEKSAGY